MIIWMGGPFAKDHPDRLAFCERSSRFLLSTEFFSIFLFYFCKFLFFLQQTSSNLLKHFFFYFSTIIEQCIIDQLLRATRYPVMSGNTRNIGWLPKLRVYLKYRVILVTDDFQSWIRSSRVSNNKISLKVIRIHLEIEFGPRALFPEVASVQGCEG